MDVIFGDEIQQWQIVGSVTGQKLRLCSNLYQVFYDVGAIFSLYGYLF